MLRNLVVGPGSATAPYWSCTTTRSPRLRGHRNSHQGRDPRSLALCSSPWQGAQKQKRSAVAIHRGTPAEMEALPHNEGRLRLLVPEPRRNRDDSLKCNPAPCAGRVRCRSQVLVVTAAHNFTTYDSPRHSHASVTVWRGHHRNRIMAGSRECGNDTHVC